MVVVSTTGIEFFKLFPKLSKIMTVRNYPLVVGHYWFESTEGILVAASSPPKLGQFSTFFVNQNKGAKFFNGQRFNCDLAPSVTDKWTESPPNITSLTGKKEIAALSSPHSVCLAFIYGTTYFVHLQCLTGRLKMFKVTHEKVSSVQEEIQLPVGSYGIRVVDNLLVMQNFTLQETYVIDIKSSKYSNSPFYVFWNDMKETLPDVTVKIRLAPMGESFNLASDFLYDGKSINTLENCATIKTLKGRGGECAFPLSDSLVYIDKDICVDTKEGRCYKILFTAPYIIQNHPDQVEAILFLLRRSNCKILAFQYLKRCLKNQIDLSILSRFFAAISSYYKIAALEKKLRRAQTIAIIDKNPRKYSSNSESDMKIEEGMTVLLQSDVFLILFQPLFEENSVPMQYFILVIQEYMRSLILQDLQVQQNIQILFVKLLLKSENYIMLQHQLQLRIISDSSELATLLLANSTKYPNFFQMAVDILYRIKALEKLIDTLIGANLIYEAVKIMQVRNAEKVDIMKIIKKCEETLDEKMMFTLTRMIKEWALLNES